MNASPPIHAGLLRRISDFRDVDALSELYDQCGAILHAVIVRIIQDSEAAEGVLVETFADIWRKAGQSFSEEADPLVWLVTLSRKNALDWLHAHDRLPPRENPYRWTQDKSRQSDTALLLNMLINRLHPQQRRAVELAFYGGLGPTAIGDYLDMPSDEARHALEKGVADILGALEVLKEEIPEMGDIAVHDRAHSNGERA